MPLQVKDFKYLRVLFVSEGTMEGETNGADRRRFSSNAALVPGHRSAEGAVDLLFDLPR